jgi:hypothetical protein
LKEESLLDSKFETRALVGGKSGQEYLQGPVLDPILFLFFINNLDAITLLMTAIKNFANDTSLDR